MQMRINAPAFALGFWTMDQDVFYDAMGWNPSTLYFDRWLGTATPDTIAKLGPCVRPGHLVGYEPAGKHPTGWGYRHVANEATRAEIHA
jgi:hypothetical protein